MSDGAVAPGAMFGNTFIGPPPVAPGCICVDSRLTMASSWRTRSSSWASRDNGTDSTMTGADGLGGAGVRGAGTPPNGDCAGNVLSHGNRRDAQPKQGGTHKHPAISLSDRLAFHDSGFPVPKTMGIPCPVEVIGEEDPIGSPALIGPWT